MPKSLKLLILSLSLLVNINHSSASLPFFNQEQALPSLAPILKKTMPAIVNISVTGKKTFQQNPLLSDPFFEKFFKDFGGSFKFREKEEAHKQQSIGSGVIIDAKNGYIVTNYHVIKNADNIFVTLINKQQIKAKLIGTDEETDLALLQITEKNNITELIMADSDQLQVGDFAVAIGHPFSLNHTVTSGIISGLGRNGLGMEGYEDFIQTDASINPGNSGGALINLRGELIGINSFILSNNGNNIGIGFAIPTNIVKSVTDNLIKFGTVKRGQIGVYAQNITPDLAKAFDLQVIKGALIAKVNQDSPASKAGLQEGDVIIKVNDKEIDNISDLRNIIGMQPLDSKVQVEIIRNKSKQILPIMVRAKSAENMSSDRLNITLLKGADFANMTEAHPLYGKIGGVIVKSVEAGTAAWKAGLKANDIIVSVNKQTIKSIAELEEAAKLKQDGILLNIKRDNAALFIVIN